MPHSVGLDVSQKMTAICVVDPEGRRIWRGDCPTQPEKISALVSRHARSDAKVGVETGAMTPWLVHGLRASGLQVECLDARRVKSALQMRLNKTDHNDAEGLAQVVRTGWYRAVHVKSLEAHQARSLLGARARLVRMRTRLANMIRGVLKKDILRATRRHFSAEDKIWIVLDGLCRKEGIAQGLYYTWSKEFMEAGKRRLAGDTASAATTGEVQDLRREARALKECMADLTLENRLLKKAFVRMGATTNEVSRIRKARDHHDGRAIAPACQRRGFFEASS